MAFCCCRQLYCEMGELLPLSVFLGARWFSPLFVAIAHFAH